jgi:predicted nucleic acid-binding protein
VTAESIVIDTDVASRLMRRTVPASVAARLTGATLVVTFVTAGELHRGAVHARWGARRLAALDRWLTRVVILPADAAVARHWGEITGTALRAGRPLPANDAWVAACCLAYDAALATLNKRHFAGIDGLRLVSTT